MGIRHGPEGSEPFSLPALLAELPVDLRERVNGATLRRQLNAGDVFALEQDPCPGLCFVEVGLVKVFKLSADGREQVLLLSRTGHSFADASAFTGQPMPASVVALESSTVLILPADALHRLIDEDPRFARAVIRQLSLRLQHVVQLVEDLSFRHVQARVAKVLLQSLLPQTGVGAGVGRRQLSQREIAEMVGTAREVVSRSLRSLADQGLIRIDHGQIELIDPTALLALL